MRHGWYASALALMVACTGDTKDTTLIPPPPDSGTDTTETDTTDTDTTDTTDTTTPTPDGLCEPLDVPAGAVAVAAGADLQAAVDAAADGATLALAAGTYNITTPIVLNKPITLMAADADAASVVLDGNYVASDLLRVTAGDVTIAHLTLKRSGDALIQVDSSAADVPRPRVHMVKMIDPGRAGVTNFTGVEVYDAFHADDGEVSCNEFDLTDVGRDEVVGLCGVTGIEVYGGRGWTIRDNRITNMYCDIGFSGPAITATRGSRDTVITRNQLVDVSFGIVLGETADQIGRVYDDAPCGSGVIQHIDGWVTNNIVAANDADLLVTDGFLSGIRMETSCNINVLHNSVFSAVTPELGAIEQKYTTTTGLIANNLLSDKIVRYPGADADVVGNYETATLSFFFFPAEDDFHTSPGATYAIDQGDPITIGLVTDDVDGAPRDDGAPDIGADEI